MVNILNEMHTPASNNWKSDPDDSPRSPVVNLNSDSPVSIHRSTCSPFSEKSATPSTTRAPPFDDVRNLKGLDKLPGSSPQTHHILLQGHNQMSDICRHFKKDTLEVSGTRNSPNDYIWRKIESLIERMMSEEDGIPVRNVKSLMSTIPSTFTGSDVVHWLMQHVGASDVSEAINLASRIACMGYIFCIDDHTLVVKNDSHTYYRFQTPFLYPSRCMEADTIDYAVYLSKRTMQNKQRLELAGFEAERLASLQHVYCHKWEFVYIQAEAEAKVDKKRDKLERLVLDSQERAYWDVHRPPPGCINTTDVDMRKLCRAKRPKKPPSRPASFPIPSGPNGVTLFSCLDGLPLCDAVAKLNASFRPRIKTSKAAESLQNFSDQYSEYDLLLSAATSSSGPSVSVSGQIGPTASSGQLGAQSVANTLSPTNPLATSLRNTPSKSDVIGRNGSGASTPRVVGSSTNHDPAATSSTSLGAGTNTAGGHVSSNIVSPSSPYDSSHDSSSMLNPWISDNPDYWNTELRPKYLSVRRVKRWSFSIYELLKDPVGLEEFQRWLEKEFSAENLRFWQACQELKGAPIRELRQRVSDIYNQYLAPNAVDSLNVDSRIADSIRRQLSDPSGAEIDRFCFDEAESHIFHLMKSDSYYRFLRSDYYRELFASGKKKSKKLRSGVGLSGGTVAGIGGLASVISGPAPSCLE